MGKYKKRFWNKEKKFENQGIRSGAALILEQHKEEIERAMYDSIIFGSGSIYLDSEWKLPKMTWDEFDKMGRISYGEKYRYNEYAIDGDFAYVVTNILDPEWPTDFPWIQETVEIIRNSNPKALFKVAIAR